MENTDLQAEIDLKHEAEKQRGWIEDRRNGMSFYDFYSLGFDRCRKVMCAEEAKRLAALSQAAGLKEVEFKRV